MNHKSIFLNACLTTLLVAASPLPAGEPMHLRALAFKTDGSLVADLKASDWKASVGGADVRIVGMAGPAEVSKAPISWAFVLLPIQNPDLRKLTLVSIARFMETLPASDRVMVAAWSPKGLVALTPGFTTRPSLWAAALGKLVDDLHEKLEGNPAGPFSLPPNPAGEAEETTEPVRAFAEKAERQAFPRLPGDARSHRTILDDYQPSTLGGWSKTVQDALVNLESLAVALQGLPGEKQVIVFSRNEIDDLSHPIWARTAARSGSMGSKRSNAAQGVFGGSVDPSKLMGTGGGVLGSEDYPLLQAQLMISEVKLARLKVQDAFAREGLVLHNVASQSTGYDGALGEAVFASGGHTFRFTNDLPKALIAGLGLWTQCYRLDAEAPAGLEHPAKVSVSTSRKDVKIIAPGQR